MQMLPIFALDCNSRELSPSLFGLVFPQGSAFEREVEYLWIFWYSCTLAGWIDAESQRIDREMEVGIEGQMERRMIGGGGLLFLQPIACGYCAITVGLVWVLYYCTIWRIVIYCVRKEHFYPSLILYQVLKNLKAFQPTYWWTVFKGPMACHVFFVFFLDVTACVFYLYVWTFIMSGSVTLIFRESKGGELNRS